MAPRVTDEQIEDVLGVLTGYSLPTLEELGVLQAAHLRWCATAHPWGPIPPVIAGTMEFSARLLDALAGLSREAVV